MTTNRPEVVAWLNETWRSATESLPVVHDWEDNGSVVTPLVRLSDYEALREEYEKLRAENRNLKDELFDYYTQNKCGCGHPACKRCRDDRFVEDVLADTQPAPEGEI